MSKRRVNSRSALQNICLNSFEGNQEAARWRLPCPQDMSEPGVSSSTASDAGHQQDLSGFWQGHSPVMPLDTIHREGDPGSGSFGKTRTKTVQRIDQMEQVYRCKFLVQCGAEIFGAEGWHGPDQNQMPYPCRIAWYTRSGDSGRLRRRLPTARLTALATAPNGGMIGTSPTPFTP